MMKNVKVPAHQAIDYYFSVLSDWAYLGSARFEHLANRYDLKVNFMPVRLAEIYANSGGVILQKRSKQRQDYRVADLKRWSKHLGVPVVLAPKFYPTDDEPASRAIIAAQCLGLDASAVSQAILRAIWREDQDISDTTTLINIAGGLGLDGAALVEFAAKPAIARMFDENTANALKAGVFGSPFYIYGDEIYWGQDQLDFLEAQIKATL